MIKTTNAALFFLAAGIFTSVTVLSAYQILFAIPLAYYTYLAVKNKEFKLPKSAWWLLAFTAVAFISLVINFDVIPKPSKNFGRLKYFLFGAFGIFVMKVWLQEASDKSKKILLNVFFFSILVAGAVTAYNKFIIGDERPKGLTDTMRFGYGLGMFLLTLLSAILHHKKIKSFFDLRFGIAAFIVGLLSLYMVMTRGAILGFVCGLPFVLYFYRPKWGIAVGIAALLTVGTLGSFYFFGTATEGNRLLQSKDNGSDTIRRSQWQAAYIATKEKPVLGWGFSNFSSQLKRIKNDYDLDHKEYNDAHSHNIYLEVSSGTGLIGLFFFMGWLLTWAWEAFKSNNLVQAAVIPFGVCFMISSFFEVTFDANNASMIFMLYAMSLGIQKS